MEELVNKIKKKLSIDNLVEMMKETRVIDETRIREEDVRRTLEKTDIPNNIINVEELTAALNVVTEEAAARSAKLTAAATTKAMSDKIISSMYNALIKGGESIEKHEPEENAYMVDDNVSGFFD